MSLPREEHAKQIAGRLHELAAYVKTCSRANLTDANRVLETISARFFNALFGWDLVNLNVLRANFPAADLGDRRRRIVIQVTNEEGAEKITRTADKAGEHRLGVDFDRLIIFFLLPRKPEFPRKFVQPAGGPTVETWDVADLTKQLLEIRELAALALARSVLDEEMGKIPSPATLRVNLSHFDVQKYAPAELIGREEELKLLNDAWDRVRLSASPRPRVLTFVALGGEGKTSLVAKWAAELAHQDWPGCDAAFAWSFYSQGASEQKADSSDLFLERALTFFGDEADKAFATSPAMAFEKGQRLARLVGQQRSLLILDGLEPLQYSPASPTPGELKDQGVRALLRGLASGSHGLCVVTTRYSLPDLKAFWQTTAPEVQLLRLSRDAGVHLLKILGVKGSELRNIASSDGREKLNEFEKLVEDVKGHALTLTLLGGFLKRAFHGDIRQRDRVKFDEADAKMASGHVFRVMAAYVKWLLADGGEEGRREVAVLRLTGLFDRPADVGCLSVLRTPPAIAGLTDAFMKEHEGFERLLKLPVVVTEEEWEFAITGLEAARLLAVNRDSAGAVVSLDTHPHIREYFAMQLREQNSDAWRAAHRRLYKHLREHKEGDQPTLGDLQPLYQAVTHGCYAGLIEEAFFEVYHTRIRRREGRYSTDKLGAFGSDLGLIALCFEQPWVRVSSVFNKDSQAWLLNTCALCLRALGRLTEALEPTHAAIEPRVKLEQFSQAAIATGNLSELKLTLGHVAAAVGEAEQSVAFADRGGHVGQRYSKRTTLGHALHLAGRLFEAEPRFREAEQMHQEMEPNYPLLYSLWGFWYCDLLLAASERAVWQEMQRSEVPIQKPEIISACRSVSKRAAQTLKWVTTKNWLLDMALDHLTLGCAALFEAILSGSSLVACHTSLENAVFGFRRAASQEHIPRGLLARAWLRFLEGKRTGHDSAQTDLDEAWEIAERGPMRLFMADIHLYRARLFGGRKSAVGGQESEVGGQEYPWESPQKDLAEARRLIEKCGYWRRKEELEDAERFLRGAKT